MHARIWWYAGSSRWSLLLGGLLSTGARAQVATPPVAPPLASAAAPLVLRGITVIDVQEGQRLPQQTVVIVGNRIQALGPAGQARVPKGARVVDAQGQYLIPGLWDMHVHPNRYVDIAFPLLLAKGVTGVRDAGSMVPLDTLSLWKREIAAGTRVGPRYLVSGPAINEPRDSTQVNVVFDFYDDKLVTDQFISVPRAALGRVVDSLKAAGADFIKTYFLSRTGYFALATAARGAGMLFGGHVPADANSGDRGLIDGREASDSGATFLDHDSYLLDDHCGFGHPDSANLAQCTAAAQQLRRNNTWTVQYWQGDLGNLAGQPEGASGARHLSHLVRYGPHGFPRYAFDLKEAQAQAVEWQEPTATADWVLRSDRREAGYSRSISLWLRARYPIVIGTDFNLRPDAMINFFVPGFSLQESLMALVLTGMTPLEALRTATLNPALALRATDSLGTVAAGKVADVVLLDADPLVDIWNVTKVRAVVTNGRYYDRNALDRLLLAAEQAAAR